MCASCLLLYTEQGTRFRVLETNARLVWNSTGGMQSITVATLFCWYYCWTSMFANLLGNLQSPATFVIAWMSIERCDGRLKMADVCLAKDYLLPFLPFFYFFFAFSFTWKTLFRSGFSFKLDWLISLKLACSRESFRSFVEREKV